MRIGEVLERYRHDKRITTRDLGKEIGLSAATISRIENGQEVEAPTLIKLFHWLFCESKT